MSDSDHLKEALKEVLLANRSIFAALMLGTFAVGERHRSIKHPRRSHPPCL
jgi:hypothetical protein